jgi:hypothetical protein
VTLQDLPERVSCQTSRHRTVYVAVQRTEIPYFADSYTSPDFVLVTNDLIIPYQPAVIRTYSGGEGL